MQWKSLLISCLLILMRMKSSSADNVEKSSFKIRCYDGYCDNWGECYVKNNTRNCRCMKQYYSGHYCDEIANHCVDTSVFKPCSQKGTKECIPYFGARYCKCRLFYMGETCEIRARANYKESSFVAVYFFLRPVVKTKNYYLWIVYKEPFDSIEYSVEIESRLYTCSNNDFKKAILLREVLALPMYTGSLEQKYYCLVNHTFRHPGKKYIKLHVLTPKGRDDIIKSVYLFRVNVQTYLDKAEITGELPFRGFKRKIEDQCIPTVITNFDFCSPNNTADFDNWRPIMSYYNYTYKIPRFIIPCTPNENITLNFYYKGLDKKGNEIIEEKIPANGVINADNYPFGKVWLFITEVGNKYGAFNYTCYCGARYSGTPTVLVKSGTEIETEVSELELNSGSYINDFPNADGPSNLTHVWSCEGCQSFINATGETIILYLNDEIFAYDRSTTGRINIRLTVQPTDSFLEKNGIWKIPIKHQYVRIWRRNMGSYRMIVRQKHTKYDEYFGTVEIPGFIDVDVTVSNNLLNKEFCVSMCEGSCEGVPNSNDACSSSNSVTKKNGNKYTTEYSFTIAISERYLKSSTTSYYYTVFLNTWLNNAHCDNIKRCIDGDGWYWHWDSYYCSGVGWYGSRRGLWNDYNWGCGFKESYSYRYKNPARVIQILPINKRELYEANKTLFQNTYCNFTDDFLKSGPDRNSISLQNILYTSLEDLNQNYELRVNDVLIRYDATFCMDNFYWGSGSFESVTFEEQSVHGHEILHMPSQKKTFWFPETSARTLSLLRYLGELDNITKGQVGYFSFSMQFAMKYQDINSLVSILFHVAGEFHHINDAFDFPPYSPEDYKYHELLDSIFDFENLTLSIPDEGQLLMSVLEYFTRGIKYPLNTDTIENMLKNYETLCSKIQTVYFDFDAKQKYTTARSVNNTECLGLNARSISRLFASRRIIHKEVTYEELPDFDQITHPENYIVDEYYYDRTIMDMDMKPYYAVRNATNDTLHVLDQAFLTMRAFMIYDKRHNPRHSSYPEFEIFMTKIKEHINLKWEPTSKETYIMMYTAKVDIIGIDPVKDPNEEFAGYMVSTPNPFWWEKSIESKLDCIILGYYVDKDLKYKLHIFILDYYIPFNKRSWYDVTAKRFVKDYPTPFEDPIQIPEDNATVFKVRLTKPIQPIILQLSDLNGQVHVAYDINKYPLVSEILNSTIILNEKKSFYQFKNLSGPKGKENFTLFIGFVPKKYAVMYFKISLASIECEMWNFTAQSWQKWGEVKDVVENNRFICHCNSSKTNQSIYTGLVNSYKLKPRYIFQPRFIFSLYKTYIIPTTATLMLLIFFLLLYFAGYQDYFTIYARKAIFLYSNRRHEQYAYLVVTVTGVKYDAGTSSSVGIVLYGENVKSKRHVLRGYNNNKPIMQSGSTDFFWLTTGRSLGDLCGIYLWIDYAGLSPSWYCEKVYIIEISTNKQWVFYVNDWFSLNYRVHSDFNINRFTPITRKETIESYAVLQFHDLKRSHLWISLFHADYCGCTPRFGKVIIAFGALFLMQFTLLPLYRDEVEVFDNLTFNFNDTIKNAVMVSLYTFGYHCCCLILLWRNPVNARDIPWRYLAFGCIFIGIILAYLVLFSRGKNVGTFMSIGWLSAFLLAFLIDLVVIQTFLLLLKGILWRWVLNREEFHRFDCEIESTIPIMKNKGVKVERSVRKIMFFEVEENLHWVFRVKERKVLSYRSIIPNLLIFFLLIIIAFTLHNIVTIDYRYHNLRTMNEMLVYGNYSKSMGLNGIQTEDDIYSYIRTTLKYAMFWQRTLWMIDAHLKVMGVARITQTRFLNITESFDHRAHCMDVERFRLLDQCYKAITNRKLDDVDYHPNWMSNTSYINLSHYTEFWANRTKIPFRYTLFNSSDTYSIDGKFYKIPGGGYSTLLGRNIVMMNRIVDLLQLYNWIDNKTRTVVIELFAFDPDSYFFNNIKIIIERSHLGPFHAFAKIDPFYILFLNDEQESKNMIFMIFAVIAIGAFFSVIFFYHIFLKSLHGRFSLGVFIDIAAFILTIFWINTYIQFINTVEKFLNIYATYLNNEYHSIDLIYPLYIALNYWAVSVVCLFIVRISTVIPLTSKIQKVVRYILKSFMVLGFWLLIIFLIHASLFANSENFASFKCSWWFECFLVTTASFFAKIPFPFPYNIAEIDSSESFLFWIWYQISAIMFIITAFVNANMLFKLQKEHAVVDISTIKYTYFDYIEEYLGRRNDYLTGLRKLPPRKNRKKWRRDIFKTPFSLLNHNKDQDKSGSNIKSPEPEGLHPILNTEGSTMEKQIVALLLTDDETLNLTTNWSNNVTKTSESINWLTKNSEQKLKSSQSYPLTTEKKENMNQLAKSNPILHYSNRKPYEILKSSFDLSLVTTKPRNLNKQIPEASTSWPRIAIGSQNVSDQVPKSSKRSSHITTEKLHLTNQEFKSSISVPSFITENQNSTEKIPDYDIDWPCATKESQNLSFVCFNSDTKIHNLNEQTSKLCMNRVDVRKENRNLIEEKLESKELENRKVIDQISKSNPMLHHTIQKPFRVPESSLNLSRIQTPESNTSFPRLTTVCHNFTDQALKSSKSCGHITTEKLQLIDQALQSSISVPSIVINEIQNSTKKVSKYDIDCPYVVTETPTNQMSESSKTSIFMNESKRKLCDASHQIFLMAEGQNLTDQNQNSSTNVSCKASKKLILPQKIIESSSSWLDITTKNENSTEKISELSWTGLLFEDNRREPRNSNKEIPESSISLSGMTTENQFLFEQISETSSSWSDITTESQNLTEQRSESNYSWSDVMIQNKNSSEEIFTASDSRFNLITERQNKLEQISEASSSLSSKTTDKQISTDQTSSNQALEN